MTVLTDQPEATEDIKRVEGRNRFLLITVVVLGVVAVVLGFLMWNGSSDGSTLPAEVEQVIDDYNNAIVAQDPDAWRATITDDWYYGSNYYGPNGFLDEMSDEPTINEYARTIEFWPANQYEQLSDPLTVGDGPWFVTLHQRWTEEDRPDAKPKVYEGTTTFVVIEQDQTMKVTAVYWTGTAGFAEE